MTTRNRILVTGGTGFVGRHLVAQLARQGRAVVATTTGALSHSADAYQPTWVRWDATNCTLPEVDWETIDAVVHLAKPRNAINPCAAAENYALSVAATTSLLTRARDQGVRRFLFASTGYALGARNAPALENDRTFEPRENYGVYKACGELITASFQNSLSTAVLRLFFPYGPHAERFFVNRMVNAVQCGAEIRLDGPEGVRLNPVWIDDLVDGILRAIDSDSCGTFHLAGPESVTLLQLCRTISAEVGRKPVFRQVSADHVDCHVGDTTLARRLLGFLPICDLRIGLRRLIASSAEVAV